MGYIIEITSEEKDELKDKAKKLLKIGKEMYECIDELAEGQQMGERGGYGRYSNRGGGYSGGSGGYSGGGGYGNRYGNREDEWDDDDDDYDYDRMGERRGVRGTGRYSRYRR